MKNSVHAPNLLIVLAWAVFTLLPAPPSQAEDIQLKLLPTGAMKILRGYLPQKIELSTTRPDGIKKAPADLTAPLYGQLKLGPGESPTTFFVILDEPDDKPSRLFVDANANGDFTDDPPAEWEAGPGRKSADGREYVLHTGGATFSPAYGVENLPLHLAIYRFDKHDPQRAPLAMSLFYYGDYARTGAVKVGDKSYDAILTDWMTTGDFRGAKGARQPALLLDLNGDGKFDRQYESFPVDKPFNVGGTTYEISGMSASGATFALVKSAAVVAETKPMLSVVAGGPSIPFQARTTDGKTVNFPEDFKGKAVLLDFWATWCGPCIAEMPNVSAAYEKLHAQGFEILGISLDREKSEDKLASVTQEKNMPWPQVYDGKYWAAEIAQKYYVESIPQAYLIDGDTGTIIAEGASIRGELLIPAIEKALAKKTAK